MLNLLKVMIGMILNGYPLKNELMEALNEYERDNNLSPRLLVEKLLEDFLYDEGYLTVDVEVTQTPAEIQAERNNKFHTKKVGKYLRLFYDDLDFGMFKPDILDNIIDALLGFSDKELLEMSKQEWKGEIKDYKPFLYDKLGINPPNHINENSFIYPTGNNKWCIQKNSLKYGSYDTIEKAKEVRAFLIMKNWDKKYSNKMVKLKDKKYRDWLYQEMKKEGVIINEQSDNIQ